MTDLSPAARMALHDAGFTPAQWAAMHGLGDTWTGDTCGCPDPRCANGFHHDGADDCGCLQTLLEDAVAWRAATREPNRVELAPDSSGLYRYVNVATPGALTTVAAAAGEQRDRHPAETVIQIEAREGWTVAVTTDERGRKIIRVRKAESGD